MAETDRKSVDTMKTEITPIPIAGYTIPADHCPYPIQESITTISPPSYESTINPENDQGFGWKIILSSTLKNRTIQSGLRDWALEIFIFKVHMRILKKKK